MEIKNVALNLIFHNHERWQIWETEYKSPNTHPSYRHPPETTSYLSTHHITMQASIIHPSLPSHNHEYIQPKILQPLLHCNKSKQTQVPSHKDVPWKHVICSVTNRRCHQHSVMEHKEKTLNNCWTRKYSFNLWCMDKVAIWETFVFHRNCYIKQLLYVVVCIQRDVCDRSFKLGKCIYLCQHLCRLWIVSPIWKWINHFVGTLIIQCGMSIRLLTKQSVVC